MLRAAATRRDEEPYSSRNGIIDFLNVMLRNNIPNVFYLMSKFSLTLYTTSGTSISPTIVAQTCSVGDISREDVGHGSSRICISWKGACYIQSNISTPIILLKYSFENALKKVEGLRFPSFLDVLLTI